MAEIFRMPKLGMDMEEGTIVKWLKAEGESVVKGEPLVEIETDKSTVEVESPAAGTVLKIWCPEGDSRDCGLPVAAIGQPGEEVPALVEGDTDAAPQSEPAPAAELPQSDLFFLMPKLGMDMEEGAIVKWLKAEGDEVKKGEPFAEIETDKSTVEVEALSSGVVLKLYYPEGETLACGKPIAAQKASTIWALRRDASLPTTASGTEGWHAASKRRRPAQRLSIMRPSGA